MLDEWATSYSFSSFLQHWGDRGIAAVMKNLEQLIQEEMAAAAERVVRLSRLVAVTAFEQSFAHPVLSQQDQVTPPTAKRQRRPPSRSPVPPRSREIIKDLSNRFLDAVRTHPGETMAGLAPILQINSAQLHVPMRRLKKAGKLKTVGQRQFTRYFPVDGKVVA